MVPATRRRMLQGVAVLGCLAGCLPSESGAEFESHTLRVDSERSIAWFADGTATDEATTARSGPVLPGPQTELIASAEKADRLRLAGPDDDSVEAAREFVEATEFDSETVLVAEDQFEKCYRLEHCAYAWQVDSLELQSALVVRDGSDGCSDDETDWFATFVRIPKDLDPDATNSLGWDVSPGECGTPTDGA